MFAKDTIQLAISPLSWSNDDDHSLGGDIPFEQCIDEMAEAGYEGTEVGHKFPRDPDVLGQALAKRNLRVASQWFSAYLTEKGREQETIDNFIEHMNFLKAMGANAIVVCECSASIQQTEAPIIGIKPTLDEQQWVWLTDGLEQLGQIAKDNEMVIAYHHHMGTVIQTLKEVDHLMAKTDPDLVSLLLDTGHITFAGDDPLAFINSHGSRIKHVHLKDIRKTVLDRVVEQRLSFMDAVREGVFTVPGDGMIDYRPIFDALAKVGYSGWFVVEAEQDSNKANPLEYAKKARRYIKEIAGL